MHTQPCSQLSHIPVMHTPWGLHTASCVLAHKALCKSVSMCTHTRTSPHQLAHAHTCVFRVHTSPPLCTCTQPHFHVHTSMVPGILVSARLYLRVPAHGHTCAPHLATCTHIQSPLPPFWLWAPGSGPGRRAGVSARKVPLPRPQPGGRQVHGPGPRLAGREGAVITRPRGAPHAPFIPATPVPGPDAHYRLPARSLARVGGGSGVRRAGPCGEDGGGGAGARRPHSRLPGNAGERKGGAPSPGIFSGFLGKGVL